MVYEVDTCEGFLRQVSEEILVCFQDLSFLEMLKWPRFVGVSTNTTEFLYSIFSFSVKND